MLAAHHSGASVNRKQKNLCRLVEVFCYTVCNMSSSKNVFAGLLLIIGPWALLVLTLSSYAISSFVITAIIQSQPCEEVYYMPDQDIRIECGEANTAVVIGNLFRIFLGASGMVGVVGILVGNPFGLYLLFSAMMGEKKVESKK